MKSKAILILGLLFGSFIVANAFGPSQIFSDTDKADYKKLLISPKSLSGLKNTYYSVYALKKIGAEVADKSKVCEAVKSEPQDKEELFYAVATNELLGCGRKFSDKVIEDIKATLTSNSFKDLTYGLSSVLVLRASKSINVDDKTILAAATKLINLGEDDGTYRLPKSDEGSVYYGGIVLQVLAQVATDLKLAANDKASFEDALTHAADIFDAFSIETDATFQLTDSVTKVSNLKVTAAVFKGYAALAKALGQVPDIPSKESIAKMTEFFVERKFVSRPDDAAAVVDGIYTAADNVLGVPIVVQLAQGSISPSAKDGNVNIRVSNVLGSPINSKLVLAKAYPANAEDKVLISNQEVTQEKGTYVLNFLAAKPEPGFYILEFKATPAEKGSIAIPVTNAIRSLKVNTVASIADAQLLVADSEEDIAEGRKYSAEYPKSVDGVLTVENNQFIGFNFKVKAQSGKAISVQQAFLKLSKGDNEHYAVATNNGRQYSAVISVGDLSQDFLGQSGTYELTLIVGDAVVHNPISWKVASLNIKFSNNTLYENPENPFAAKSEIQHIFRTPEKRPNASISFAFTIACLAPILIFLIGLLRVGANASNFPSLGGSSIYGLGFQVCLGAILGLFALYWFSLNMMQTLRYLGILLVPTFFFGVKTLNALAVVKTKKD